MSLIDRIMRRPIVVNQIVKEKKDNESINEKITKDPFERVRETLSDWGDTVLLAENPFTPLSIKRLNLFNLFRNIAIDPHLFSLTETIYNRVRQTPFNIHNEDGSINDDVTKLFKRKWFSKFIRYALDSEYWGFSLIQFTGIKDGSFADIDLIDRFYVRPEKNGVAQSLYDDNPTYSYDKKPYLDWTMFIEGNTHLGRFNIIAKRFILKREVIQFWAVFNELYTTPYLIGKTNFNSSEHRDNLFDSLDKRKHSGFQVIDKDDEIVAVTNSGNGYVSYEKFEDSSNKAMSKAFIGATMITDDGSSRSQAEVHEGNTDSFIQSFRLTIEELINDELIPMMQNHGMKINTSMSFKWELSEKLKTDDWATIIGLLSQNYNLNDEQIEEKIGLEVERVENPIKPDQNMNNIENKINQFYNKWDEKFSK